MRRVLSLFFFIAIQSCNSSKNDKYNGIEQDSTRTKEDGRNIRIQDALDSNEDGYIDQLIDSGIKDDFDQSVSMLENRINLICDSAIYFLQSVKDTSLSHGLQQSFKMEKETFKSRLADESEIIFMSYGKPSTAHEDRQAAANGYYYLALREKYNFLENVYQNTKDNFEFP